MPVSKPTTPAHGELQRRASVSQNMGGQNHSRLLWCGHRVLLVAALLFCWMQPSLADVLRMRDVLSAVVAVRAEIPADARTATSLGTLRQGNGIVIDDDGLIVTIGYLILEAQKVDVVLADGTTSPASIVAYDHDSGFGLLRMGLPFTGRVMSLEDSNPLAESDPVLVASHGGMEFLMPARVVARREFAGYWEYLLENAIFTAPPHPLFSGAALIGQQGGLLGVGSLLVNDAVVDQYVPGNMFVPIAQLKPVLDDLLRHGRSISSSRPWLGIYSDEQDGQLRVSRVAADGPADRGGIERGDWILAVANEPVSSMADFYRKVWGLGSAGTKVPLTIMHEASIRELEVTSDDRYNWLRILHPKAVGSH